MAKSEHNLADYDTCDIHESTYPIHGKCSECVKEDKKTYSLEEALPLVANGREFSFVWNDCNKILSKDCHFQINTLFDYRFELIPNHIKSLDELKDLEHAKFCGEHVVMKGEHWLECDGEAQDLALRFSTAFLLNIENWEYFEGGE